MDGPSEEEANAMLCTTPDNTNVLSNQLDNVLKLCLDGSDVDTGSGSDQAETAKPTADHHPLQYRTPTNVVQARTTVEKTSESEQDGSADNHGDTAEEEEGDTAEEEEEEIAAVGDSSPEHRELASSEQKIPGAFRHRMRSQGEDSVSDQQGDHDDYSIAAECEEDVGATGEEEIGTDSLVLEEEAEMDGAAAAVEEHQAVVAGAPDRVLEATGPDGPLAYCWVPRDSEVELDPDLPLNLPEDILLADTAKKWMPPADLYRQLRARHIILLKKPSPRAKKAKYVCKVCDIFLESLLKVQGHVDSEKHRFSAQRFETMQAATMVPPTSDTQLAALTAMLTSLYTQHGLTPERRAERQQTAAALRACVVSLLEKKFNRSGYGVSVFGSSMHGCGFLDSSLDMMLTTPNGETGTSELLYLAEALKLSEDVSDVTEDFTSRLPGLVFRHVDSGLRCRLVLDAARDVDLAHLVLQYCLVDQRCALLAFGLRYIARLFQMDDPHKGSLPPSAYILLVVYFLQQCCTPPVLPVLHELDQDGGLTSATEPEKYMDAEQALRVWGCTNIRSAGFLWLRLLHFYSMDFPASDLVVCVRQKQLVTRADKGWGNRKLAIEDPFQTKRNVSRSISNSCVGEFIYDRLRETYVYCALPRTAQRGAPVRLRLVAGAETNSARRHLQAALAEAAEQEMYYCLDQLTRYAPSEGPPLVCRVCQKAGHVDDDCPTLTLVVPGPLPSLSEEYLEQLNGICYTLFAEWAPLADEYTSREKMLKNMESWIRGTFPTARLNLFGSSYNGFGLKNSDLDICMTFEDCEDPESLDQAAIITELAETLRRMRSMYNIIPITTAKVPIVKFTDRRSQLEGDISLYNVLGQYNTLLLHTYAQLDMRARMLGYVVKLAAKICDIGDASRGSLSSYAYTLMVIYYLQQLEPPVLPVLQELEPAEPQLVDGWDVQFFRELNRLADVWPEVGRNKDSTGQLWTGFIRFYTEQFDFDRHVVCIRRKRVMTKFEKLWNYSYIAIEDPFLLSHNLGGGVGRKMATFIRRTLLKWRQLHCAPPRQTPPGYRDLRHYLFSTEQLSDGPPPNSHGCLVCGHIGHWARDCPQSRRNRTAANRTPNKGKPPPATQNAQALVMRQNAVHVVTRPQNAPHQQNNAAPPAGGRRAAKSAQPERVAWQQNRTPRVVHQQNSESLERQRSAAAKHWPPLSAAQSGGSDGPRSPQKRRHKQRKAKANGPTAVPADQSEAVQRGLVSEAVQRESVSETGQEVSAGGGTSGTNNGPALAAAQKRKKKGRKARPVQPDRATASVIFYNSRLADGAVEGQRTPGVERPESVHPPN